MLFLVLRGRLELSGELVERVVASGKMLERLVVRSWGLGRRVVASMTMQVWKQVSVAEAWRVEVSLLLGRKAEAWKRCLALRMLLSSPG